MLPLPCHYPIFFADPKKPKRLAVSFPDMLVMHLVCDADGPQVRIIQMLEDINPSMHIYVMYEKVSQPI